MLLAKHVLLSRGSLRLIGEGRLADDLSSLVEGRFLSTVVFVFPEDEALLRQPTVLPISEKVYFEVTLCVFGEAARSVSLEVMQRRFEVLWPIIL